MRRLIGLSVLLVLATACSHAAAVQSSPPPPATTSPAYTPPPPASSAEQATIDQPSTYLVTYEVVGTARSADLTYQNAEGDTVQKTIHTPWRLNLEAAPGAFLYLSAQNNNASGSVTCRIYVTGQLVRHATSTGAYKICDVSGTL